MGVLVARHITIQTRRGAGGSTGCSANYTVQTRRGAGGSTCCSANYADMSLQVHLFQRSKYFGILKYWGV